jgi:mannosidase alpha-like ER degradation enhancer 2
MLYCAATQHSRKSYTPVSAPFKVLLACLTVSAPAHATIHRAPAAAAPSAALAAQVKSEFLHAWNGYRAYAWGHDALRPLSRTGKDWYGASLLMTPVDALDTLLLMGLTQEAQEARELIVTRLSFDQDLEVKHFEIVIRLLGGLLSAYQMSGDARLLKLADDLGTRLLPAFASPTGLPYVYVNLRTGKTRGTISNPAEAALILEYGTLSKLTGKSAYLEAAQRSLRAVYARRSSLDLVGERFDVESGAWTNTRSHIGARIDSYYEYLWKCWRLFADSGCRSMWQTSSAAALRYYPQRVRGTLWYGQVDMNTGARVGSDYGALDAFFPGLLAYSGHLEAARRLHAASVQMWDLTGIEPETYDFRTRRITDAAYPLRPEIIESTWYLYRQTGEQQYRVLGARLFRDFVRYCRTPAGYAALADVRTKEQLDDMESFVLAETFKYFYLLFAAPATLDPQAVVLNTEGHPLRATWRQP